MIIVFTIIPLGKNIIQLVSESEQSNIAYLLKNNSFLVSIFDGYSSNCEILGDREDRLLKISVRSKPPQWDTMRACVGSWYC